MSNMSSNLSVAVDWDNQAKPHNYIAMNYDGDIRLFKNEPTLVEGCWIEDGKKGRAPQGIARDSVWPKSVLYYAMSVLKRKGGTVA